MKTSDSIAELSKALAKFQEEVKQPAKEADNPFFRSKYVPLDHVVETINTFGPKNGLAFIQLPVSNDAGKIGVVTVLSHSSGEFIQSDPFYMTADKQTAQGAGSVITYARRYALSAMYGIASETDDDANHASGNKQDKQQNNHVGPKKASDKQIKMLHTKVSELARLCSDTTYEDLMSRIKAKAGCESTKEMTAAQASKGIAGINELIEKNQPISGEAV